MCKYIANISFIILFSFLTSCESFDKNPPIIQEIQEKGPINQEEELESAIKELEIRRKEQITHLMDKWKRNIDPKEEFQTLLKQGDIEGIYQAATKGKTEAEIKADLSTLRHDADHEKEDYSVTKASKAILEKDLYKLYECYFLEKCIKKTTKQAVDEYFETLEREEASKTLQKGQKKQLQLLSNWKNVEPTLKLEQEKRTALKKLQEANKS